MSIEIKIDIENGKLSVTSPFDTRNDPAILTPEESIAAKIVEDTLEKIGVSKSKICYRRYCEKYLSVVTHEVYDFMRIKTGPRSNWFSVLLSTELRKKLIDDQRFKDQENKKQLQWKVKLNSISDLECHRDLIRYSYESAEQSYQYQKSESKK